MKYVGELITLGRLGDIAATDERARETLAELEKRGGCAVRTVDGEFHPLADDDTVEEPG